jgi:hypothetical protein
MIRKLGLPNQRHTLLLPLCACRLRALCGAWPWWLCLKILPNRPFRSCATAGLISLSSTSSVRSELLLEKPCLMPAASSLLWASGLFGIGKGECGGDGGTPIACVGEATGAPAVVIDRGTARECCDDDAGAGVESGGFGGEGANR